MKPLYLTLVLLAALFISPTFIYSSTANTNYFLLENSQNNYFSNFHDTSLIKLNGYEPKPAFTTSTGLKRLRSNSSFTFDDFLAYFETNELLESGHSWIKVHIGLWSNLKLDRDQFKYSVPPVSLQYERALNYNFTAVGGIGGQLIKIEDSPIKYQYYNLYVGGNYHVNLEPLIGIRELLPYFGVSTSYRLAVLNGYEGQSVSRNGKASIDATIGVKYHLNNVGFLLEFGSIDTSCFRFGFFFSIS